MLRYNCFVSEIDCVKKYGLDCFESVVGMNVHSYVRMYSFLYFIPSLGLISSSCLEWSWKPWSRQMSAADVLWSINRTRGERDEIVIIEQLSRYVRTCNCNNTVIVDL